MPKTTRRRRAVPLARSAAPLDPPIHALLLPRQSWSVGTCKDTRARAGYPSQRPTHLAPHLAVVAREARGAGAAVARVAVPGRGLRRRDTHAPIPAGLLGGARPGRRQGRRGHRAGTGPRGEEQEQEQRGPGGCGPPGAEWQHSGPRARGSRDPESEPEPERGDAGGEASAGCLLRGAGLGASCRCGDPRFPGQPKAGGAEGRRGPRGGAPGRPKDGAWGHLPRGTRGPRV